MGFLDMISKGIENSKSLFKFGAKRPAPSQGGAEKFGAEAHDEE